MNSTFWRSQVCNKFESQHRTGTERTNIAMNFGITPNFHEQSNVPVLEQATSDRVCSFFLRLSVLQVSS